MEGETQLIQSQEAALPQQSREPLLTPFIWKFFSIVSWTLLLITSIIGYIQDTTFFCIHQNIKKQYKGISWTFYYPISIKLDALQAFFLILLGYGFFNFAYFGLYKNDEMIINPLFNKFSNFHFVPLLLVSLINIVMQNIYYQPKIEDMKGHLIIDIIATILALGSLILIYIKTNLVHDWFIVLTIKKGVFSFLIIILWYNFFYLIVLLGYNNADNPYDFFKGTGITFSLFIGIGSLIFSLFFKDLIAAITNFLIYVGMINSFFGYNGNSISQKKESGGVGDGVIEIIIMIINLLFILYLVSKHSDKISENKYSFKFS